MHYVGIDPGMSSGAIVVLRSNGDFDDSIELKSLGDKHVYLFLKALTKSVDECQVVLEKIPPAIFGSNKSSMAKLYGSYRSLQMALTACNIDYEERLAAQWQNEMHIPKRKKKETTYAWKGRLLKFARKLFPDDNLTRATADAAIIAEYCRRLHKGTL